MHQDFVDEYYNIYVETETVQELFNFTFNLTVKPNVEGDEQIETDGRL